MWPLLAWQQREGRHLIMRQLPLTTGPRTTGKRTRSPAGEKVNLSGLIYGTTLGNIVAHAKMPGQRTTVFVRMLRERLETFARMHCEMRGADKEPLAQGLASGRVAKAVVHKLSELRLVKVDSKLGGRETAIGATAAILISLELSASCTEDATWLVDNHVLTSALESAIDTLVHSADTGMSAAAESAKGAEVRALQRAALGVKKAHEFITELRLRGKQALALQVSSAARAAFPACRVSPDTQQGLLRDVATNVNVLAPRFATPLEAVGAFVPLSAIPRVPDSCVDESSSSASSVASFSSVPSSASWASAQSASSENGSSLDR